MLYYDQQNDQLIKRFGGTIICTRKGPEVALAAHAAYKRVAYIDAGFKTRGAFTTLDHLQFDNLRPVGLSSVAGFAYSFIDNEMLPDQGFLNHEGLTGMEIEVKSSTAINTYWGLEANALNLNLSERLLALEGAAGCNWGFLKFYDTLPYHIVCRVALEKDAEVAVVQLPPGYGTLTKRLVMCSTYADAEFDGLIKSAWSRPSFATRPSGIDNWTRLPEAPPVACDILAECPQCQRDE